MGITNLTIRSIFAKNIFWEMPEFDMWKISEKFRNKQLCAGKQTTKWNYSKNLARHKFIPGGSLKGQCSMLKPVVNDNLGTLTIFGRTDLVNSKSQTVTHANWRREITLPVNFNNCKFKCYQEKNYVVVDIDLQ